MITTEKEAKEKTCYRTLAPIAVADAPWHSPGPCIASECMAWRWFDPKPHEGRRGYCGAAGKP